MKIPSCFSDIASDPARSPVFDGLRGAAAVLVAAGHFGLIFPNYAKQAVWIFFALSGYLLSLHGLKQDLTSYRVMASFFVRRVLRLYPLFFVAIVLCSIFGSPNCDERGWTYFVTRSSLMYAEGFFWTIKQEMVFYILLPFLLLALLPLRRQPLLSAAILSCLAILSCSPPFLDNVRVAVDAANDRALFIGPFLIGMVAAYVQPSVNRLLETRSQRRAGSVGLTLAVIALIAAPLTVPAGPFFTTDAARISVTRSLLPILVGLVLLEKLPQNIVSRTLHSLPLRAIGLVGYGFYMWHWPINLLLERIYVFHGLEKLLITGAISYAVACVTYCWIERPAMRLARTRWLAARPPRVLTTSPEMLPPEKLLTQELRGHV